MSDTKYIIITEKSDARNNFSEALGGTSGRFPTGEEYVLAPALAGHLLSLPEPIQVAKENYKELVGKFQKIDTLPWKYEYFDFDKKVVRKFKGQTPNGMNPYEQRIQTINSYLKKGYIPMVATDIDDSGEGDLLALEILRLLFYNGPIVRELHKSENKEDILASVSKPISISYDYAPYLRARERQNADYMTQSLTRIATVQLQEKGVRFGKQERVRVGRVQSYAAKTIGDQLEAIKNYKPSSVFISRYQLGSLILKNDEEPIFATKEDWKAGDLPEFSKVKLVRKKPGKTPPVKPYFLTALLQALDGSGLKTNYIKKITEAMYHAHYISYPRTPANQISLAQFEKLAPYIDQHAAIVGISPALLTHREPRMKTHVTSKEVVHEALTPLQKIPANLADLDQEFGQGAALIYKTIVERYLMMYLEDTEWVDHDYETVDTPRLFTGTIRIVTRQGAVDPDDESPNIGRELPDLSQVATLYPHEIKSKKPAKVTIKWLLGQMIKDHIGTPATQIAIVSELCNPYNGVIIEGKTLELTMMGWVACRAARMIPLGSAEGTAAFLDAIAQIQSTDDVEKARKILKGLIDDCVKAFREQEIDLSGLHLPTIERVTVTFKGVTSSINRVFAEHRFTDEELDLLSKGETIAFSGIGSKKQTLNIKGSFILVDGETKSYVKFEPQFGLSQDFVRGMYQGQDMIARATYFEYRFTQEELKALFAGQSITIQPKENQPKITGQFEVLSYIDKKTKQKRQLLQFKVLAKEGYHLHPIKNVFYKTTCRGYQLSDMELAQLDNDEKIRITLHKKETNEPYDVEVVLANQESVIDGKLIKWFGPRVLMPLPADKYEGIWKGQLVRFKNSYRGTLFTEAQCQALCEGKEIEFHVTTSTGERIFMQGSLAKQTFEDKNTGKLIHYVGFKPNKKNDWKKAAGVNSYNAHLGKKPEIETVTGVWCGAEVTFKRVFMHHRFTDEEVESLLNDEYISFVGITNAGKEMVVTGKLDYNTYREKTRIQFCAKFDNEQGPNDGLL